MDQCLPVLIFQVGVVEHVAAGDGVAEDALVEAFEDAQAVGGDAEAAAYGYFCGVGVGVGGAGAGVCFVDGEFVVLGR